jgi:hypothetical protein
MRRPVAIAASGLLVALVLSACVPGPEPAEKPTFPATPVSPGPLEPITAPEVLELCPDVTAEHLDGFAAPPQAVYACRADDRRPSDGTTTYGPWQSAYRILDPAALLRSYAVPNRQRSTGPCLEYLADPLILWVHAGGRIRAFYAPVDECGFPQEQAATAYQTARRLLIVEVETPAGPLDDRDTPAEH